MNKRLEELCGLILDDNISSDDFNELQSLLEQSKENRHFYYEICEVHALLKDQHEYFRLPITNDLPASKAKWKVISTWVSATAALFIMAFVINKIDTPVVEENIISESTPHRGPVIATLDTSIGSEFEYGNDKGKQPNTGDGVKEGAYTLNQGIIQLNYSNGAEVIIEAPASFQVISEKLITCSQGKLSVYAPEAAKNFTVRTPVADIIDLGTEFSVWVEPNQFVEAHVFKGSIKVDLQISGISTYRNLVAQDAVRIIYEENEVQEKENVSINDIDLKTGFFIRNLKEAPSAYSKLIQSLGPVVYFPMEMSKDGSSLSDWSSYKNDASANHIAHKDNLLVPGKSGNALHLSGANHRGFLYVPDYPKSPLGELSVSAWVYAKSRASWGTIIKNWGNKEWGQFHFGLNEKGFLDVEIMTNDHEKVHIRENIKLPTGSWQHVAFVHNGSEVYLYRNGKLLTSKKVNGLSSRGKLKSLGIGTKISDQDHGASSTAPGHWDGSLDEIAIFNYSITDEQVHQLYKMGM